jgi:hypothetical protein
MSSTQEVGEIFGEGRGPAHAMLRSPTVLIASVGLWGMNVFFYRLFGINYIRVLKRDFLKIAEEEEAASNNSGGSGGSPKQGHRKTIEMTDLSETSNGADDADEDTDSNEAFIDDVHSASGTPVPPKDRSGAITWERLVSMSVVLLFLLHFTYM